MVLYTIGCPKCKVLEKKLISKNIKFDECHDETIMKNLGINEVPVLKVDNKLLNFNEAVQFINNIEVE